ncbi:hypothetical protein [Actinopolymorpha rutila]|uniref:Uncharacterized protein n=1 Tax=Actinopolymorpha rutila TaxID=446787 RepID=A0A852ZHP3_9ACTN|nr:hypothetical protein [Actinopolymorpha rutila]NYH92444.1 hypothetical protein [Actinopolymorpha rutila]
MTTTERTYVLPETTKPTTIEAVSFRDGMIVTADDLDAAMRYPTSLLLTVFQAFFGCGVVCGLALRPKQSDRGGWVLCVDRGVAIDGRGYPIELCAPVELDLSPEACACEPPPDRVCIAVRRITSDEAPHDACTCDLDEPRFDCRRVRDYVMVKAFTEPELDALGDRVCRRRPGEETSACTALTACSACGCGESWILLGCVALDKDRGIVDQPDTSGRRWVKPVEAVCAGPGDLVGTVTTMANELSKLTERVAALEKRAPEKG